VTVACTASPILRMASSAFGPLMSRRARWWMAFYAPLVVTADDIRAPRRAGRCRPLAVRGGPGGGDRVGRRRGGAAAADADLDPGAVRADATRTYPAFALPPGGPGLDGLYLGALAAALTETGAGGTVAIEPAACPDGVLRLLEGVTTVDVAAGLRDARATKTAEEVERLRACAALTAVGQRAARAAAVIGMTELELFAEVRRALDADAGRVVALSADLLSGIERTAEVMGGPGLRVLAAGAPVICDLVPGLAG